MARPTIVYGNVVEDQLAPVFAAHLQASVQRGGATTAAAAATKEKVLEWMGDVTQCSDWTLTEHKVARLPSLKVSLLLAENNTGASTDNDCGNNECESLLVEIPPWEYLMPCPVPPSPASQLPTGQPKRWRFLVEEMCHPSGGITLGLVFMHNVDVLFDDSVGISPSSCNRSTHTSAEAALPTWWRPSILALAAFPASSSSSFASSASTSTRTWSSRYEECSTPTPTMTCNAQQQLSSNAAGTLVGVLIVRTPLCRAKSRENIASI